jgi:hypothetical protein
MAGKSIRCPRCDRVVTVPTPGEPVMEVAPVQAIAEAPGAQPPALLEVQPCPQCQADGAEVVPFTLWGSFYFTALFHHVRCPMCGYCYNGRTGRSNFLPAAVCVAVPLLGICGLIGYILWVFHSKGYF